MIPILNLLMTMMLLLYVVVLVDDDDDLKFIRVIVRCASCIPTAEEVGTMIISGMTMYCFSL